MAKKKTPAATLEGVDAELVGRLVEQARAAGLQLTGEGGLLQQLTDKVMDGMTELQNRPWTASTNALSDKQVQPRRGASDWSTAPPRGPGRL